VVSKADGSCESDVVAKTEQMVFDTDNGGLKTVVVEAMQQSSSSLSDPQIAEATQKAIDVENLYRRPQDIEFCVDGAGKFFVLQARPVTRVDELGPAAFDGLIRSSITALPK